MTPGHSDDFIKKNDQNEETALSDFEIQERDGVEDEAVCGFGGWAPSWIQWLASKKYYIVVHGLIGMNTFALSSYFLGTISTIEKRFKIPSKTTGAISSAWDIGSMIPLVVFTYFGSRGNKSRWIAAGTCIVAMSSFLRLLPHILYGPGTDSLKLTVEHWEGNSSISRRLEPKSGRNGVSLCGKTSAEEDCDADDAAADGVDSVGPAVILFLAHILLGVGHSTYHSLGYGYIDDNSRKEKSPIYMALSTCIRMLGPTFGFMMASYSLRQYVDPSLTPVINNEDPRWIGAWWMGWITFGIIGLILAMILSLFPKQLPRTAARRLQQKQTLPEIKRSFADFKRVIFNMLKNKILMFNTGSGICFIFGLIGYWTFSPKYMETQFRQSASSASFIAGSVGLVATALGLISSSVVISRVKPSARSLAAWCVITEAVDFVVYTSWAFVSCTKDDMQLSQLSENRWDPSLLCNKDCNCGSNVKFSPVCSLVSDATFFSPCHAGCTEALLVNSSVHYSNCSCISGLGSALEGACVPDCSANLAVFIALQCIQQFLSATGRAGNFLINMRCVDECDKSVAIAFSEMFIAALGYIPGPIIYGLLLDDACMVWGESCGKRGNCWIYDAKKLRFLMNFFAAGCVLCGTVMDMGVWFYSKDLQIYDEEPTTSQVKASDSSKEAGDCETETLKS